MAHFFNPPEISKPFSRYSHGAIVDAPRKWLYISGQVGARVDGSLEGTFEDQAKRAWENLFIVLASGGMAPADLVKVSYFLTRTTDIAASREIRDKMLHDIAPATTLLIVSALGHPDMLIEVEAVAAR